MEMSKITVKLSKGEFDYLKQASFLHTELLEFLEQASEQRGGSFLLTLRPAIAQSFRDYFTQELARVGFNCNYELTDIGEVLEDLIDRFFVECEVDPQDRLKEIWGRC